MASEEYRAVFPNTAVAFNDNTSGHMYVTIQVPPTKGSCGGGVYSVNFRMYANAKTKKTETCECDHRWLGQLEWMKDAEDLYKRHLDGETGREVTVREGVLRAVPRVHVRSRKPLAQLTGDPAAVALTHVPFVCAQTEKRTFGVLASELFKHLGVHTTKVRRRLAEKFGVKETCLFFHTMQGNKPQWVVPFDLIPDVFGLFDHMRNGVAGREGGVSLAAVVKELERTVEPRTRELELVGYGLARVAVFMEKMILGIHLQTVTHSKVVNIVGRLEEENTMLRGAVERYSTEMRKLTTQVRMLDAQVRGTHMQQVKTMATVEQLANALLLATNMVQPVAVGALPGVDLESAARHSPYSLRRRDQTRLSPDAWRAVLAKMAELTGVENPIDVTLDETFLRYVASERERASGAVAEEELLRITEERACWRQWNAVFQTVREHTGLENPRYTDLLATFNRLTDRKRPAPGSDGECEDDNGPEVDDVSAHPSPAKRSKLLDD